jgi:hypothetical protein
LSLRLVESGINNDGVHSTRVVGGIVGSVRGTGSVNVAQGINTLALGV